MFKGSIKIMGKLSRNTEIHKNLKFWVNFFNFTDL